jgi:hypothetical protein
MTTSGASAAACGDLTRDDLVEGDMHGRVQRGSVDELECEVVPGHRPAEGTPHGDADALGGEAEGMDVRAVEDGGGRRRQVSHGRRRRKAGQCRVQVGQGLVGFEEEVPGQADLGQAVVAHLQVDDDELASGDLVLTVHGSEPMPPRCARAGRADP